MVYYQIFVLNWRITGLQCCVSLCYTTTWTGVTLNDKRRVRRGINTSFTCPKFLTMWFWLNTCWRTYTISGHLALPFVKKQIYFTNQDHYNNCTLNRSGTFFQKARVSLLTWPSLEQNWTKPKHKREGEISLLFTKM